MVDVSLATSHLFDREHDGSGVRLARGGCGGCGGGHGGGGCGGHGGGGCARGHGGGGFSVVAAMAAAGWLGAEVAVVVRLLAPGVAVVARLLASEVAVVAAFVGDRGCGGFRGCRGFRGCGCGGCGFTVGFDDHIGGWGDGDLGYGDVGYGGCCASWGACRWC